MPALLALSGPLSGMRFELEGELVLGRGSGCPIRLVDERVSRRHAVVAMRRGRALVEDLHSRNGTFVNGVRVEAPVEIRPGDELRVGGSLLIFEPPVEARPARHTGGLLVLDEEPLPDADGEALAPPAPDGVGGLALRLAGWTEEGALLEAALRELATTFGADRGALLTRGPGETGLEPAVLVGRELILGRALAAHVLSTGRPRLVEQPRRQVAGWGEQPARRLLLAPLLSEDGPTGLVALEAEPDRPWTEADAAGLHARGAVVGVLLDLLRRRDRLEEGHWAAQPAGRPAGGLLGESVPVRRLLDAARDAARTEDVVELSGEAGSGREDLARYMHAHSPRAKGAFLTVVCGDVEPEALERLLYGEAGGASRGGRVPGALSRAHGGSLFLAGWDEVPPDLRREVERSVRAGTASRVGAGRPEPSSVRLLLGVGPRPLRAGTGGVPRRRLRVPPLRERLDDLPALFEHFARRAGRSLGRAPLALSRDARRSAEAYPWPGNVRELALWVERLALLKAAGAVVGAGDLPLPDAVRPPAAGDGALAEQVAALEAAEIARVLREEGGLKVRAARRLGISRPTLDRKIAQYGIRLPNR